MRSTTFALLGITAAMGLGLVAVASQQSFSLLPAAPIPGLVLGQGEIEAAIAVPPRRGPSPVPHLGNARVPSAAVTGRGSESFESPASQLAGSRRLTTAPPAPAAPADPPSGAPVAQQAPPTPDLVAQSAPSASPSPPVPVSSQPAPPTPPVVVSSTPPPPPVEETDEEEDEEEVEPEDDGPEYEPSHHHGRGRGHGYGHAGR